MVHTIVCTFHHNKEEVVRLAPMPTHRITHKDGSEADIYIASTLQQQLDSQFLDARKRAQSSICINFREACSNQYDAAWAREHKFIDWNDLEIQPLVSLTQQYQESDDSGDCDECPSCEIGYHERCRQSNGCPVAVLR
jgi:hypothetical protein